ncbi:P-loop NTPase [Nostoc sp. JL34]|uniref:P-loop NTPase n=1 Tax=Nostoc sp. JL34 TaxID=2815397 RepID=UPI0025D9140C|nr:P-loop NTPase [Nostoc sp. JL34]
MYMFRQVGVPVLGIIENMSYLICGDCGSRTPIFGSGGGEQLATELQAPLLGQIPIDPRICSGSDTGNPIAISEYISPAKEVFTQIAISLNTIFTLHNKTTQLDQA